MHHIRLLGIRGVKKFCIVLVSAKGQIRLMKTLPLMFFVLAFGISCLVGQTDSRIAPVEQVYRTECFVVNHTPHPIHLAFYDAHQNLCARESDDLVLPGHTLNFGSWSDPQKFINPLDSVNIVITSDKRKWVIRSVLMREKPRIHDLSPRRRDIYYSIEWSEKAYYR